MKFNPYRWFFPKSPTPLQVVQHQQRTILERLQVLELDRIYFESLLEAYRRQANYLRNKEKQDKEDERRDEELYKKAMMEADRINWPELAHAEDLT